MTDRVPVKGKGTFKYHTTLREGFDQTVRVPSYGEGGILPNRHITFIVAKKA